jgi:hypothetical protein
LCSFATSRRGWASYCDLKSPLVIGRESRDLRRLVVDQHRLEPSRLSGGAIAMLAEPRTSPATATDSLGHEQIDHHAFGPDPDSRLLEIQDESTRSHRLFEPRRLAQLGGIKCDVAVARVRRDRQIAFAGMEVDRLRADEHESAKLIAQRLERVQ